LELFAGALVASPLFPKLGVRVTLARERAVEVPGFTDIHADIDPTRFPVRTRRPAHGRPWFMDGMEARAGDDVAWLRLNNPNLTVQLFRPPLDEWVGIRAQTPSRSPHPSTGLPQAARATPPRGPFCDKPTTPSHIAAGILPIVPPVDVRGRRYCLG
jgi:hypothetical protein